MLPLAGASISVFYFLVFAVSVTVALALTPLARKFAISINFVDAPDNRKVHLASTPYMGGAALWMACATAMLIQYEFLSHLTAWAVGATMMMVVGLWDDRHTMGPGIKLLLQISAAVLVVIFGDHFNLFGFLPFDQLLTIFWIVGLSNAVNLLDNMDGLSAGTTGISCFFLFVVAALNGQFLVGALALSIFGACLGFLRYNFAKPVATIFMGDAGSLFLGFTLAFAGVRLRLPLGDAWDFLIPVLILGLPILDTTLVTLMRIRAGRPVSQGGKDHCSHRLVALGYTKRKAVLAHYTIAVLFGAAGVAVFELAKSAPSQSWLLIAGVVIFAVYFFRTVAKVEVYAPQN